MTSHPLSRLRTLLVLAVFTGLAGCRAHLAELNHHPAGNAWSYADSLTADFGVAAPRRAHRIRLSVALTDDYPYSNLYLRVRLTPPQGAPQTATPEFVLQNALGDWNVERLWTGEYHLTTVLNDSAVFGQPGRWRLSLAQYTRSDTLLGVDRVRFIIEPRDD